MGGKKIVAIDLWQCCCRNGRKNNCGNGIAEIGGKKKELWQWSCRKLEERERERELPG